MVVGMAGARLSVEDWIGAAGDAIKREGVAGVAVEPLARRLGATKGSFYWHFASRDALLEATLARWEEDCTTAVIEAVQSVAEPSERLRRLFVRASSGGLSTSDDLFGPRFELALASALEDPLVGPLLRRVSARRLEYVERCFSELGLPADEARGRARLAYTAYLGGLRLARELPDRELHGSAHTAYLELVAEVVLRVRRGDQGPR
jgi:AcrR family transcriptional regulator